MKKPHNRLFYAVFNWWVRWGSNPRPRDYESNILFYLNYNYLIMLKVMPAQIHHLQPNRV